jgi:alkylated DNA repair dioxygenase AlkB
MQPQVDLFSAAPAYPEGLVYVPGFLDRDEEATLLAQIAQLPIAEAKYRGFVARRRTMHFGFGYDFTSNRLQDAPPLPAFLHPLRAKVAALASLPAADFVQGLVTEYRPGAPIGWHRDVPQFGVVVGVSLASACRMRFRPYPPARDWTRHAFTLALEPRSAYVLRDTIRWGFQHSIPEVDAARWSITFRTMRDNARRTGDSHGKT